MRDQYPWDGLSVCSLFAGFRVKGQDCGFARHLLIGWVVDTGVVFMSGVVEARLREEVWWWWWVGNVVYRGLGREFDGSFIG